MKKTLFHTALLVLIVTLGLFLMRCERTPFEADRSDNVAYNLRNDEVCEPLVTDLWTGAGMNDTTKAVNVGTVSVTNDTLYLYVTYNITEPDTYLYKVHMWVGIDYMDIPENAAPVIFPYKDVDLGDQVTEYEFEPISLSDLGVACDDTIYIAAHAVVYYVSNDEKISFRSAWAWGEDTFIEHGIAKKWGWFFEYIICCPEELPGLLPQPMPGPEPMER
jgi:hypothetical protein